MRGSGLDIGFNSTPTVLPAEGAVLRAPAWLWDLASWEGAASAGFERCLVIDGQTLNDYSPWNFDATCQAIATTYPDAEYVETGNEPDGSGPSSTLMSKGAYYALIRAARAAWPEATIIAGGLAGQDLSYADGSEVAGADLQGAHVYTFDASTITPYIEAYRDHTLLPVAVTEIGAQAAGFDSEHDRAVFFSNALIDLWEADVPLAIIYRYDQVDADPATDFSVQGLESEAAIASAIPALAGAPPEASLIQAIDISGAVLTPALCLKLYGLGCRRIIQDILYGDPALMTANMALALSMGFVVEASAYLMWGGDPLGQVNQALALAMPYAERLWLDCEDNGNGTPGNPDPATYPPTFIISVIQSAIDQFGSFPYGIYSGAGWWEVATDNYQGFANLDWWVADWDGSPDTTVFIPFGGVTAPICKQYAGNQSIAGILADLDVFVS